MNLASFPLALLLPCDAFHTASLSSLIVEKLAYSDRDPWGLERRPEGWKYRCNTIALSTFLVTNCSFKMDVFEISSAQIFVVFIFDGEDSCGIYEICTSHYTARVWWSCTMCDGVIMAAVASGLPSS